MSILNYFLKYIYVFIMYKFFDNLIIRFFRMYYIYKKKLLILNIK